MKNIVAVLVALGRSVGTMAAGVRATFVLARRNIALPRVYA